jgi:Arm DNA-binding domain
MLLTSWIVPAARPRERRYILPDEHGMSLHVMPWGSKYWRFRYRFEHTERMISLGVYPHVNLATARVLHADARGLLARHIDPSADRKERRAAKARTFELLARQWFKLLRPRIAKGQLAADTVKDATPPGPPGSATF